jgi:hypothetical protein
VAHELARVLDHLAQAILHIRRQGTRHLRPRGERCGVSGRGFKGSGAGVGVGVQGSGLKVLGLRILSLGLGFRV